MIKSLLKRPYFIYSFLALFLFLGIFGYNNINRKLFPNSNRPEVAVVIVEPGASAKEIASNIAVPVERELYTLDNIRRVYSTTIDEVTVIHAEFNYGKNIDAATTEVTQALSKIKNELPPDIREPQVYKIDDTLQPIVVISVSSKKLPLTDVREIAENDIKDILLKIDGVANVDVFGGYKKEVMVIPDKKKLDRYGLSPAMVIAALSKHDRDFAIGSITGSYSKVLLKIKGKRGILDKIKNIPITKDITIGDIAKVYFGHYENSALYYGDNEPAIALAVQRETNADVIKTIDKVEKALKVIKKKYPALNFHITDTQKDTILQSTTNMFESLRDAIVMSTIVVFFFLASFRQVLVVLFTIPLVYATTVALMWLTGIEFNVVTLTAIILALGLLLDDAVVVMENIERHYRELKKPIKKAVIEGTEEIMFSDLAGTITTMAALFPIMFVGDYPQTIFRPLAGTLLLALAASYAISITAVPLLSLKLLAIKNPFILKTEEIFESIISRINNVFRMFFHNLVKKGLESKKVAAGYVLFLIFLFVMSVKGLMPIVGKELMPPMDTGIVKIGITVDPNLRIKDSEKVLKKTIKAIYSSGKVLRVSSSIGSEPGVLSIGSGGGIDSVSITATYVNRFERRKTIWQIEDELRKKIAKIPNIEQFTVSDYGATALSSIRGNIDVTLYSSNFDSLEKAGKIVEQALYKTKGITCVAKTWNKNKKVYILNVDEKKAAAYGLTPEDIAMQLSTVLRGIKAASFPVVNAKDFTIRVWLEKTDRDSVKTLENTLINSKLGKIPLSTVAKISYVYEPNVITREGLQYTLDVYGFRKKAAITHIMASFEKAFKGKKLPPDVKMEQTGDIKQFNDSAKRMLKAIGFAVLLIFFVLVPMFNSVKAPLLIIVSIPLTLIGAAWSLLIFNYHISMPAMMGFVLLSGIIVNNAILLIDFALNGIKSGMNPKEAILESIKIRTRPVLMTAFATTAGMLPVAMGNAIGLERLAPLGAVAIGGLIVGTFLTLVFIPLLFVYTYGDTKENQSE
ncbi:efflux RND transporter permease subunit [Desulfurobacterium sp.]